VGTGKTTLINKLLEWAAQKASFNRVRLQSRLSVSQFFDFS